MIEVNLFPGKNPTVATREYCNIVVNHGAVRASDDLSVHLDKGEALGVIGPNGSGKTTMFNIITGITKAGRGQVLFDGMEITGLPTFQRCRRGIARSFQIPHPFAGMSVFENLLVGAVFGGGQPERAVYNRCVQFWRKLDSQRNQMSELVA